MRPNVGGMDRIVRIVMGVVIVLAGLYFRSWWGVIGLVPLLTGLLGRCGLYYPFGISTCPLEKPSEDE